MNPLVLLLGAAAMVASPDSGKHVITLDQAVTLARKNALTVVQAEGQVRSRNADVQWRGAFDAAREQVDTQTATLDAAQEDLREQQQGYQVGSTTLLNVLTSQTTLDQARLDLIQARYNLRVARAPLEALAGRSLHA